MGLADVLFGRKTECDHGSPRLEGSKELGWRVVCADCGQPMGRHFQRWANMALYDFQEWRAGELHRRRMAEKERRALQAEYERQYERWERNINDMACGCGAVAAKIGGMFPFEFERMRSKEQIRIDDEIEFYANGVEEGYF